MNVRARLQAWLPAVPFGPAPMLLLLLAAGTGILLLLFPVRRSLASLDFWIFAINHRDAYQRAIADFEAARPGVRVACLLVDQTAVSRRLQAAFMSGTHVPDMVEVLAADTGLFFRGPLDDIGFLDLTERLKQTGLYDRMVTARFSVCSSRGRIFGIPHDVHPVMLAYRRDIFEQEGIDPATIVTWDDFVRVGRRLTKDIDGDGVIDRYMLEAEDTSATHFEMLLLQAGGGYFDAAGTLIMDNAVAQQALCAFARMVAGPGRIAGNLGGGQILTQAMQNDYFVCLLCPDWRTKVLEQDIPNMRGKLALMPLPAWTAGGRRTSTSGGTMLGITRPCRNLPLAMDFAQHLYFNANELALRFRTTNIIPPVKDSWTQAVFDEPRPFWSDQPIGRLYCTLAGDVPPVYVTPFMSMARARMGEAVIEATRQYAAHGEQELAAFVGAVLARKADDVRRQMARNPYR